MRWGVFIPVQKDSYFYYFAEVIFALQHGDVIQVLIEAGADIKVRNKKRKTALKMAQEYGHSEVLQILKEAGAKE
jgi:ankyrin repeat protein